MKIQNKKVLITGASGFIASHLTRRLVNLGSDVYITTKYESIIDNVRVCDVWDKVTVIEADLRNIDSLRQIKEIKPHIIFHLAAYNHVGDSFLHVSEALTSNTNGTANLIEAYDNYERFIYTSTSEVYGYQDSVPFREQDTPNPISPYSVGKFGGEQYCRMKMTQMNYPVVILRPFNTFGPYQSLRAVISEVIMKCLDGIPIEATEGKQTREFNYVSNIVDAFILAAEKDGAVGKTINIGGGEEIPIKTLIEKIHEMTHSSSELQIGALDYRPTEIWRMYAENRTANEILGWQPKISFEEGLTKTIEWFKLFLSAYKNETSQLWGLSNFKA